MASSPEKLEPISTLSMLAVFPDFSPRTHRTMITGLCVWAILAVVVHLTACNTRETVEPRFDRISEGPHVNDVASTPSVSWVDVDNDGDEDLYVLNGYGSLEAEPTPQPDRLYLNNGRGDFSEAVNHDLTARATFSGSSTWADYDNDGDLDVFVANQRNARNSLYRNDGRESFSRVEDGAVASDSGRSFSATWVDIDADGRVDLHVLNGRDGDGGQEDYVYRNVGNGRLERVDTLSFAREALPTGGAAWGDFDGDGDPDLFLPVHSDDMTSRLYMNLGNWRFEDITERAGLTETPLPYSPATSVAHWVDYDDDMDFDLIVGNASGVVDHVFENDGSGRFSRTHAGEIGLRATYVSDVTWTDIDNDGDQDFILGVWGGASEIYRNDGRGNLHYVSAGEFGSEIGFVSSVSAGDVDNDGDMDIYLTQWPINTAGGVPNLFYRNSTESGNWLKVTLEGTDSNRSAIGATLIVEAKIAGRRRAQMRHVQARTSWRSTGSLTQHVGLGDADEIEQVIIRWPSGRKDTLSGPIPANQKLAVIEGGER